VVLYHQIKIIEEEENILVFLPQLSSECTAVREHSLFSMLDCF